MGTTSKLLKLVFMPGSFVEAIETEIEKGRIKKREEGTIEDGSSGIDNCAYWIANAKISEGIRGGIYALLTYNLVS